jgi:LysR family transcriptional regulator, low CO2-responsive transcriptional regulator
MNAIHTGRNPLDSRQINAFSSLARTGSFTETARELFLTHSAISHSIRALENEMGCRLLNRMGKRVELTAAGEAFLFHAQSGLKSFAQARETIKEFKQWGRQRLKVGAGAALGHFFLPGVLARLRGQDQNFLVTAKMVRPREIATSLKTGELEIVVGSLPLRAPELEFIHLFDSPLQIVVSSSHRWAAQHCAPLKELAKEPCLLPDNSHPTRVLIDRYFAADNVVLNGIAEIDSLEVIKEMLRHGSGMSILPDWLVKDELKAGVLAGFSPGRRRLRQSWGLLRLRGRPVNSAENSFRLLCLDAAKSMQSAN